MTDTNPAETGRASCAERHGVPAAARIRRLLIGASIANTFSTKILFIAHTDSKLKKYKIGSIYNGKQIYTRTA